MMAHCARILLFATYHVTDTVCLTLKSTVCPAAGDVNSTPSWALTTEVDNRATVETIRAFKVNRIVYREYFEVDLWAEMGWTWRRKWLMHETSNTPAP